MCGTVFMGEVSKNDAVESPDHYTQGSIECIDAIASSMSAEAFYGYCQGNVTKYLWRWRHKGEVEDLKKAQWYLKRLILEAQRTHNAHSSSEGGTCYEVADHKDFYPDAYTEKSTNKSCMNFGERKTKDE